MILCRVLINNVFLECRPHRSVLICTMYSVHVNTEIYLSSSHPSTHPWRNSSVSPLLLLASTPMSQHCQAMAFPAWSRRQHVLLSVA